VAALTHLPYFSMNTKPLPKFSCLLLLSLVALVGDGFGQTDRPNIILIMADDLGYEGLAVNGADDYQTPELDRLAAGGMRFTHAYANPVCTPTRVKIMTGLYNVRNYTSFGTLSRDETTFGNLLKANGYRTAIAGKWQLGREADSPQHFGFEQSFLWQQSKPRTKPGGSFDSRFTNPIFDLNGTTVSYDKGEFGPDLCADFILDFIKKNQEGPFLVYYPMLLTHCPFVPMPISDDWDTSSPGSKNYRGDPAYFGDMVTYMDQIVGRIVKGVEALGLSENTIIIFTGDNGTDKPVVTSFRGTKIRGGKRQMSDAGTWVPLIGYAPGIIPPGTVSDTMIDFTDFLPTLCSISGTALPKDYPGDGVSFWNTLQGDTQRDKQHAYIWYSERGKTNEAKVYARTQTRMLRRAKPGKPLEYYDSSKAFQLNAIDINSLAGAEQAIFDYLQSVIEKYDQVAKQRKK